MAPWPALAAQTGSTSYTYKLQAKFPGGAGNASVSYCRLRVVEV